MKTGNQKPENRWFSMPPVRCGLVATLLTLSSLASSVSLAESNWLTFRGPTQDGIVPSSSSPPLTWSQKQNIAFRVELPGTGWSTPIIANDRIYVSAALENVSAKKPSDKRYDLALLILDAKSGELLKQVKLFEQTKPSKIHSKNSHASSSPLVDGDRVFVHFGYQGTCCVDLDGNLIWKNQELSYKPVHGNGSTPLLVGDHLIFTCDGAKNPKVVSLSAKTGKLQWETPRTADGRKKFAFCSPTLINVNGADQVVSPGADTVMALAPSTGKVIWHMDYTGYSVVPKPLFHGGRVYLSTSFDDPSILAIDPTGKGDVTDTHLSWELSKNAPQTPSMIAHNGLIYSVSDGGVAICVDAKSGELIYQKRIGGKFSASLVLCDDRIYMTSESGETTVIQAGRDFKKLAENDLGERTLASMAVIDNAIIMRTEEALYRIEQR